MCLTSLPCMTVWQVTQAVLRARTQGLDDQAAYVSLTRMLETEGALGTVAAAAKAWRGVKQIHAQRRELLRQTQHILGKLGRLGRIDGLVCVGDPGKLVLELQSVCGVTGKAYVVNDQNPDADSAPDISAVLTRRSVTAVGEFHPFSYSKPAIPAAIADASVGLVTMNQGLHHLPQAELMSFLADIFRVLRPGGLFIVREHDATEELKPMCDAAHWVFNAVTGLYPLYVSLICMPYVSALHVRTGSSTPHRSVSLICIPYMYALHISLICASPVYLQYTYA